MFAAFLLRIYCGLNRSSLKNCRGVVPGGAGGAMADQLTLSQPGGTDYAHLITTGRPGFSDLLTALSLDSALGCFLFFCGGNLIVADFD